jgi:hypothetical protein|tara:strand:+ start:1032 stop:1268 length:237 start_codon:yes stop_codon:yes gene_type:complete
MFNWIKKLFTSPEAPKAEPLVLKDEVKVKKVTKASLVTKAELSKMTKVKLEELGRDNGIELDRRLTKAKLVAQLYKAL